MQTDLVIVGGGQAAGQTIQSARQLGFAGRITLIGEEPHLPYQRPPLSKKFLAGEVTRERLYLRPGSFYDKQGVELMLDSRAAELDLARRRVRLEDGRVVDYGRLVLATGSRVRRLELPGAELPGIHYLRTLDDVEGIAAELEAGNKLVVVGAGYIGLEVAAVANGLGLDVTVVEAADRVLSRVVCPEVAAAYAGYHTEAGVELVCGTGVTGFAGSRRVAAVELSSGQRIDCDQVVVGIGIVPNEELAARAGLDCDDGILVDECARTADGHVLAAGDCTRHPHVAVAGAVRLESVHNAIEQGKSAGHAVAGAPRPFTDVPWFWSDQYDLKLQIAGLAQAYDDVVLRGDAAARRFAAYYLEAGRVVAVDAVNSPREFMNAKKLIAAGAELTPAQIGDAELDLLAAGGVA